MLVNRESAATTQMDVHLCKMNNWGLVTCQVNGLEPADVNIRRGICVASGQNVAAFFSTYLLTKNKLG